MSEFQNEFFKLFNAWEQRWRHNIYQIFLGNKKKKGKTKIDDGNFYKSHAFLFILGPKVPLTLEERAQKLQLAKEAQIQYGYFYHNFHNRSMLVI